MEQKRQNIWKKTKKTIRKKGGKKRKENYRKNERQNQGIALKIKYQKRGLFNWFQLAN